jgi:hypothetical protein
MSSVSQPEATRLDLPQEIWLDVFRYATYIVRATTIAALDPFVPESVPTNALGESRSQRVIPLSASKYSERSPRAFFLIL